MSKESKTTSARISIRGLATILCLLCVPVSGQESSAPTIQDREKSLMAMRMAAATFSISVANETPAKRIEKPIYRYHDPARKFVDGSIWAWGTSGRPLALVTIARDERPERLMVETVVFSDQPIRLRLAGFQQELGAPFAMKSVPDVDAPHKSSQRRQSQLKLIARKFKAVEMWDNDGATDLQRYELRLLVKPIHQYSDDKKGILSGAIFLFSYGSNPELAMVLEAHAGEWKCGFGRMGWAQTTVTYNGQPFFDQKKYSFGNGDPRYLMTSLPTPDTTEEIADP